MRISDWSSDVCSSDLSELLRWLAPPHDGPEESVEVPEAVGNPPPVDHGIKWRDALLSQARAAREAIERHAPDRIVTLGGDCLVDLAPMAYLSRRYGEKQIGRASGREGVCQYV